MPEKVSVQVGAGQIHIEAGLLAKQADGAVTVELGETIVVVAAVAAANAREGQEFFPLTVDYREKAAAAGKFPGGYFKREGRPTEKEILTSRMIDRPIRPLFPKGWFNEVQVQSILLSADGENDPDILAINGASAALMVSDIPWAGPLAAVRVGRVGGEFVANPTHAQMQESDIDLVYVGSETELVMFEGSAQEIPEADFVAALAFGQTSCQPLIAAQKDLAARAGKSKRAITPTVVPDEILQAAKELGGDRIVPALLTPGKMAREGAWKAVTDDIGARLVERFGEEKVSAFVRKDAFYYIQKEAVRHLLLEEGKRLDGRGLDEVRRIESRAGLLPRAHGSALFSRGETQALALVTLGTTEDSQELDAYTGGETEKQFILHYNFPNFSVGETGRISGPGRREIGHGALAERSIEPVIPLKSFPYAIRVTSEIMESNGSTSMATVCAGSLALMDAGVPVARPVAGISVGLCTEYEPGGEIARSRLLTDIIGWEDAFGDMDCKIAGTEKGITGFQLDLKLKGIPLSLMGEAVEKARVARLAILGEMALTLAEARKDLSRYAPRILTLKINPEKIGALIGPGGKNIKRIVDESGCEINIEDDGTVQIYSTNPEGMEVARREVESLSAEIEVGKLYRGRVVTIKEFGCFVEVFPGKDGLVHISELANFRVKQTEDIVKLGDEIWVKCLGVDEKGRVRLSRRAAMEERDKLEREKDPTRAEREPAQPSPVPSPPPAPLRDDPPPRRERERPPREDRDRPAREDWDRPRGEDRLRPSREERERPAREERERPVRDDWERPPREERARPVREERERPAREERERPVRDDWERPPRENRERPAREEHERPAREERERLYREERERPGREERERPGREERERLYREERERPAREERERPARDEERERPARSDWDRPARAERDRPAREERFRPSREDRDRPPREERERPPRDWDRPPREDRGAPEGPDADRPPRDAAD